MNPVVEQIERIFRGPNGAWIIERGSESLVRLLQEACLEIDKQTLRAEKAEAMIDSDLAELREELEQAIDDAEMERDNWAALIDQTHKEVTAVRHAAKAVVTVVDKINLDKE